jgi:hypothetical protein
MPNIPPVVCTRSPISQLILNASNPSSNSLTVNFRPHKSPWPHLHRESSQTFLAAVNARLMLYSLLESEPFVFLVGPTSKRLTVHAALVKELSKPLDRLINNGAMKESNEKVAMLQYVSVETFSYFAEYCYTKNYRASPQNSAEGDVLDEMPQSGLLHRQLHFGWPIVLRELRPSKEIQRWHNIEIVE